MSDWIGYPPTDYRPEFSAGSLVLDVGCGEGGELRRQTARGIRAIGLDAWRAALGRCRAAGQAVVQGQAECLPFPDASFHGVVCHVVLPYTNERLVVHEMGRVLASAGQAFIVSHAVGYYLRYLLRPPRWKLAVYAARTLCNTWLWTLTGKRLPGFLGDTVYQSRRRLRRYYREAGLTLERVHPGRTFLGCPVFLHDQVRKVRP